jgi:formylglycine-generating enzyme required for sulfatase activity
MAPVQKLLIYFAILMFEWSTLSPSAYANNILVSNVYVSNCTGTYATIFFDLSWENSWRKSSAEPYNLDAAWIFCKYRIAGDEWRHAFITTTGHHAPAGSKVTGVSDNMGAFVSRNSDGEGDVSFDDVGLRWQYGPGGNEIPDGSSLEVKVFALEMVLIPQGEFTCGKAAGGAETSAFTATIINTSDASAAGGFPIDQSAPNADWPNGFKAFYCMKYEVSQQQYSDFLNTIPAASANSYWFNWAEQSTTEAFATDGCETAVSMDVDGDGQIDNSSNKRANRYCIVNTGGVYSTSSPDLPINFLSWQDGTAYADWAGMRPMSELEFEKVGRGPMPPVIGEYAWGNATLSTEDYTVENEGESNEKIPMLPENIGHGLCSANRQDVPYGTLRCGIFAASSINHSRQESGASYYGVMEISGNVLERIVNITDSQGKTFTAVNGDGDLTTPVSTWPSGSAGNGARGGSFMKAMEEMRLAARLGYSGVGGRGHNAGIRFVRSK